MSKPQAGQFLGGVSISNIRATNFIRFTNRIPLHEPIGHVGYCFYYFGPPIDIDNICIKMSNIILQEFDQLVPQGLSPSSPAAPHPHI